MPSGKRQEFRAKLDELHPSQLPTPLLIIGIILIVIGIFFVFTIQFVSLVLILLGLALLVFRSISQKYYNKQVKESHLFKSNQLILFV